MNRLKIDLGGSLTKLLRNPMLVHIIQERLVGLKGNDFFSLSIIAGAQKDIQSCIRTVSSQYADNPKLVEEVIGKETMDLIKEYNGEYNGE